MLPVRVIPVLLLRGRGLVKTVRFKDPTYVGDPLNTVRLFNDKEVDEIVCLDIEASLQSSEPNFEMLADLASECFMPVAFGGGIRSLAQARRVFEIGAEKVVLNTHALTNPNLVEEIASVFGDQAVIVSIDVRKTFLGDYQITTHGGTRKHSEPLDTCLTRMQDAGAGEILLTSIDRDGTRKGYDLDLLHRVSDVVRVPLIACGGAGTLSDFAAAVSQGGADAVAAGSFFVFTGKHRAVLITYPDQDTLALTFAERT